MSRVVIIDAPEGGYHVDMGGGISRHNRTADEVFKALDRRMQDLQGEIDELKRCREDFEKRLASS